MSTLQEVSEARERIAGSVVRTPCTPSEAFGELFGGHAFFKFENLQRTGSFKERGALNRILLIPPQDRGRGVIAASAGNHAQGVAYHAGRQGIRATIVMPERTPLIKVSNTERYGARVVLHGANYDEAMAEALRIRDAEGSTLVHPFDDPAVIAGQGTIGLELLEQCPNMDVVVVPVGRRGADRRDRDRDQGGAPGGPRRGCRGGGAAGGTSFPRSRPTGHDPRGGDHRRRHRRPLASASGRSD